MSRMRYFLVSALALVALVAGAPPAVDADIANNSGMSVFLVNGPTLLKKLPTLESVVPVPSIADPSSRSTVRLSCRVRAERGGSPVKGARGNYRAEMLVVDRGTGLSQVFPIASGVFRTKANGSRRFDLAMPTAIFADGFESGDVAAWAYTRTNFSGKKGTFGALDCDMTARAD